MEEHFEVKEIVGERTKDGRREYLVRWKGYPASASTWEPEENLNCPQLLSRYRKRIAMEMAGEYEVKAVLDERMLDGDRQFLIRWKGYHISESTWEFESNLKCPRLVTKYRNGIPKIAIVERRTYKASLPTPDPWHGDDPELQILWAKLNFTGVRSTALPPELLNWAQRFIQGTLDPESGLRDLYWGKCPK